MNLKTFEIWADSNIDGFENEHFEVDELIAPVIRELNLKGYTTKFCCSGHPYYMFNEAFTKTEKDATAIVGLIDTERCEDANFSVRALYIMPDNDLYIVFAGVSSNDFCLPLPDGFPRHRRIHPQGNSPCLCVCRHSTDNIDNRSPQG